MIVNVPHDPYVAQSPYNVNELRFLDDYEQPRCYVMYVMTNLRHHYRPLSRRLDRCDRIIQKESGDPNGGNMCSFSGATGKSRVRHNAHYVPYAQIRFDL